MLFNSIQFMIFMTVFFFLYWAIPDNWRNTLILIGSYYFYMCWNAKYGLLIFGITIATFLASIFLENSTGNRKKRKAIVIATTIFILGLLAYFKYFNFLMEMVYDVLVILTPHSTYKYIDIVLPVGISFFSFQALAYLFDCYNGNCKTEHNFIDFTAYIAFFPQLVAGPIERTNNLMPQIKSKKVFNYSQAALGMKTMMVGFFKKLVVADVVARYVDAIFGNLRLYSGFALIIAAFLFTIQIYCDFSGYSDIAIGSANILGITLMDNFKTPYFSTSLREFWSRWHISLSTWFRDYVYIPLGGNRKGTFRKNLNTIIVFLMSGLWHGANLSFVVWGGVHGVGQIIENFIDKNRKLNLHRYFRMTFVFIFCMFGWVFFRANNMLDAIQYFQNCVIGITTPLSYIKTGIHIFHSISGTIGMIQICFGLMILIIIDSISYHQGNFALWIDKQKTFIRYGIYSILLLIIILFQASEPATFVYFQF